MRRQSSNRSAWRSRTSRPPNSSTTPHSASHRNESYTTKARRKGIVRRFAPVELSLRGAQRRSNPHRVNKVGRRLLRFARNDSSVSSWPSGLRGLAYGALGGTYLSEARVLSGEAFS